jgi:hypothetical protein
MTHGGVEMQKGRDKEAVALTPLEADESEPVAYMVSRMKAKKPIEGLTAVDINVDVIHIIDLAKKSIKSGKPEKFE